MALWLTSTLYYPWGAPVTSSLDMAEGGRTLGERNMQMSKIALMKSGVPWARAWQSAAAECGCGVRSDSAPRGPFIFRASRESRRYWSPRGGAGGARGRAAGYGSHVLGIERASVSVRTRSRLGVIWTRRSPDAN